MKYEFPLGATFRGDFLVGDEVPPQRHDDGTIVYWTMKGPRAACPPDVRKVHPDDENFCRSRGHYRHPTQEPQPTGPADESGVPD